MLQYLIIFGLVNTVLPSTVKWLPNSSFKIPSNFKDGKLPCSKQTVVFPENIIGSVEIPSSDVKDMILPEEGEVILDGTLTLGVDPGDTNCTEGNAYYIEKTSASWSQADVWSSERFNEATPDASRIPCFNDIVEFPKDAKFTIYLPDVTQYVLSLKIGDEAFSSAGFNNRVQMQTDQLQQFFLNSESQTGLRIHESMPCTKFGCPCQIRPLDIDCSVKFCPTPSCTSPVKPIGSCCEICGGYLLLQPDNSFDMATFTKMVENTIVSYGNNSVVYHIGLVPEVPIKRVQLVVVDRGLYEGSSAEIISSINYAIPGGWVNGEKLAQISGGPLSKAGLGWKIFVSMFFAVTLVMGGIYVYYYRLPQISYPVINRNGPSVFSRFQRRTDSIVSLTRRDSVLRGSTRSATAFRNPMYDSIRGRVHVAESVAEE